MKHQNKTKIIMEVSSHTNLDVNPCLCKEWGTPIVIHPYEQMVVCLDHVVELRSGAQVSILSHPEFVVFIPIPNLKGERPTITRGFVIIVNDVELEDQMVDWFVLL